MWNFVSLLLSTLVILFFSGICFKSVYGVGDLIKPSIIKFTDNPEASVLLIQQELYQHPPTTIPTLLRKAADRYKNKPALVNAKDEVVSYVDYQKNVRTVAKAFINLGLPRYFSVGILGYNAPEWVYTYFGAILAGGIASPIDMTYSPEACQYSLNLSRAYIVVVENDQQLQKILKIKSNLPHLKTIIQYTGTPSDPSVLSWKKIMEMGENESDDKLDSILPTIGVNECCSIVYKSVTDGNPKAVMLSHDNLTYEASKINKEFAYLPQEEPITVSLVPLHIVTAQIIDIYVPLTNGGKVIFGELLEKPFLYYWKKSIPTVVLAIPKMLSYIRDKTVESVKEMSGLQRATLSIAQTGVFKYHELITFKRKPSDPPKDPDKMGSLEKKAMNNYKDYKVQMKGFKETFGLQDCKYVFSTSGPIPTELKKFFLSIDAYLLEVYEKPESSGLQTLNTVDFYRLQGAGETLPGIETKIVNKIKIDDYGEIYLRGRNVFMGYLSMADENNEVFDNNGWFHTRDFGYFDEINNLLLLGNLQEFIVLESGEYIAPFLIEDAILTKLSFVNNVALVGHNRKYLSILLSLAISTFQGSTNDLKDKDWCKKFISNCSKVSDIFNAIPKKRKKVDDAIQAGINSVNKEWMKKSAAYEIKKFKILEKDFEPNELKLNLMVNHEAVNNAYAAVINTLYSE